MISYSLKIFLEVAKRGSVTKTANELYVSQPAVTKAVKNLERRLNLKLFHRDKRRGLILSKVLRRYREKYPAVTVVLKEGTPADVQKMLENFSADFAITYSPFGNFDSEILFEDEMVGIGAEKNFVALRDGVENLIFCRAGFEVVREIFNVDAEKNFVAQNAETVVKLVEEGNGVGVISKLVLSTTGAHVKIFPVEPSIKTQPGLAAHDLKNLSPIADQFVKMIRAH